MELIDLISGSCAPRQAGGRSVTTVLYGFGWEKLPASCHSQMRSNSRLHYALLSRRSSLSMFIAFCNTRTGPHFFRIACVLWDCVFWALSINGGSGLMGARRK